MKKAAILIASFFALIIISITVYWNLPIEITRKSDIESGNKIIWSIESFQKKYGRLPERTDYKTLEKLGLSFKDSKIYLDYATDHKGGFELTYIEGLDGPYLLWNSTDRKWKIGFPKIHE